MNTDNQEDRNRAYYDDFAKGYEDKRGVGYHGLIDDLEFRAVEPLARGRRVLEAGCGTGLILERLAAVADDAWGIDLSPGMLDKARSRGLQVKEASITDIPFEDDAFDLVCSFKVLAHIPDITGAIREMARVTKPGGKLVLEFYNPWSLRYLAKRLAGPGAISGTRDESDVFTRWDPPSRIQKILPPGVRLVDKRGVRILTPGAFVHRVKPIHKALSWAEHTLTASPFARFGGFFVAIAEKSET